jgi:hypothetical protein
MGSISIVRDHRVGIRRIIACAVLLVLHAGTPHDRLGAAPTTFQRLVLDSGFAGDVKGIGDMDGDGFADLVIGGFQMYVYRYPTWTRQLVATATVEFTTDMQLGDVDGDGDLDIVTADGSGSNNVLWLENPRPSSSSSWARHIIGTHGSWAHDVEIGDLDRDGRLDVVTRGSVTNLFFQNTPTSWTRRDISSVVGGGEGMGIGDINGDGFLDIAANGAWVRSPTNPRTGTWVARSIDGGFTSDTTAAIGDMNNDGRPDVLFASQHSRTTVAWYEAPADPSAGAWTEHVIDSSMGSHKVDLGDINKDGRLDVVLGLELAEFSVYLSNGDPSFNFTKQILSTSGIHNQRIGDIGNDGDLDIFGANYVNNPPVQLWENTTPASSLPLNRWTYNTVTDVHAETFGLAFGDVNGDARTDIVSGSYWYANPGGGMMGQWTQSSLPLGMHAILVTNVDGDGLADVIAQKDEGSLAVYWLEATTSAALSWTSVRIGTVPAASHSLGAQGYRLGQVEAGGLPEVLISSGSGIYYFRIPASPASGNWPRVQVSANPSDEGFAVADIDRDGRLDVAATTGNTLTVEWYRNPGTAASGWQAFSIGSAPEMLFPDRTEIADLDRDGRLDILVSEENGGTTDAQTYWWRQPTNATSGNWSRQLIATQGTTNSMDVADMDGDGDPDVILAEHRGSLRVSIWANAGNGTFSSTTVSTGRESHLGARTIDLDNDGDLDIVSIALDGPQMLHLFRNDALGGGAPPADTTAPTVSMTAPASGSTVTGTVTVAANASDANGVVGVQFRLDGANLGAEDLTSPYSVAWSTTSASPGSHTLTAVARDAAGNSRTATGITVTVQAPSDTTPPSVALTAPSGGTTVSGTVTVSASASDASGIAGVQFKVDGANVGAEDVSAPYSVAWNTTTASSGTHALTAVARDSAGNVATSAAVTVTVSNAPPLPGGDLSANLIGYWSVDEGTGTVAQDSAGGHPGTLRNGPTWTAGHIGQAVRFDGADDYVDLGNVDISGSALTIAAWIRPDSFATDDARIVSKAMGSAEQDHYFMLSTVSSGGIKLRFRLKAGSSTSTLVASSGTLTAGQWAHAAAVYNGSAMILYLNGVEVGRVNKTGALATSATTPVAIGRNPQAYGGFGGAIDDVRLYQRALSASDIGALMEFTGTPSDTTPPSVAVTAPAAGSTVSGTVTVSANASDAGGIAGVQFKLDGANLGGEDLGAPYSVSWNTTTAASGAHTLTAVARDAAGNTTTSAPISVSVNNAAPPPPPPPPTGGTGLRGDYYTPGFGSLLMTRVDPTVNFSWLSGSPAAGVPQDNFTVRWTGQIQAPVTGTYTFSTVADDGVRLWVNGQQIINDWTSHPATTNTSSGVTLQSGVQYAIRLEYYEETGYASVSLRWAYPGQATQVIPQAALVP